MKSKIFFSLIPWFIMIVGNALSQENSSHTKLTSQEKMALLKAIEEDSVFAEWIKDTSNAIQLYEKYKTNVKNSDSVWGSDQKRLEMMENVGYTEKFELIPLIESLQGNPNLKQEREYLISFEPIIQQFFLILVGMMIQRCVHFVTI